MNNEMNAQTVEINLDAIELSAESYPSAGSSFGGGN